jgi:hypothetical protein
MITLRRMTWLQIKVYLPRCLLELRFTLFRLLDADAGPSYGPPKSSKLFARKDAKAPQAGQPSMSQPPSMPSPTVYNYVHPVTRQHIASLLPPNHPEMICLQQGSHVPQTRYGLLGKFPSSIFSYLLLSLHPIPLLRFVYSIYIDLANPDLSHRRPSRCLLVPDRDRSLPARPQSQMPKMWTHD